MPRSISTRRHHIDTRYLLTPRTEGDECIEILGEIIRKVRGHSLLTEATIIYLYERNIPHGYAHENKFKQVDWTGKFYCLRDHQNDDRVIGIHTNQFNKWTYAMMLQNELKNDSITILSDMIVVPPAGTTEDVTRAALEKELFEQMRRASKHAPKGNPLNVSKTYSWDSKHMPDGKPGFRDDLLLSLCMNIYACVLYLQGNWASAPPPTMSA